MTRINAIFNTAGKSYKILSAQYELINNSLVEGKSKHIAHRSIVSIIFEPTENIDIRNLLKENITGQIVYYKEDDKTIIKQVDFQEAFMEHYKEGFNNDRKTPFVISITLLAKVLIVKHDINRQI